MNYWKSLRKILAKIQSTRGTALICFSSCGVSNDTAFKPSSSNSLKDVETRVESLVESQACKYNKDGKKNVMFYVY